MDAVEFAYWRALDAISPVGPERQDILTAQICTVIANRHRDAKREQPFRLRDFVIDWWGEVKPRRMSPIAIGEVIMKYAKLHQASVDASRNRNPASPALPAAERP